MGDAKGCVPHGREHYEKGSFRVFLMFRKDLTKISSKISITYLLVTWAWILLSDRIVAGLVHEGTTGLYFSIAKGWIFALVTAVMLYLLTNRLVGEICRSRDFYLTIFQDFPALVRHLSSSTGGNFCNNTWLSFTGRTVDQVQGEGWAEAVHPDDRELCLQKFRGAVESRNPLYQEYRLRRHDGDYRWIIEYGKPLYDKQHFVGYISVCYDITERKEADDALLLSEKRFRELSENTSDWIWEVDDTIHYVYSSPKVTDLLGYTPEELLGKSPFDLMTAEDAVRLRPGFEDLLTSPLPFKDLENVNLHRDGSLVVLETSGIPLYDKQGKLCGFRGIDRDVTARRETEERVRSLNAELACQAAELEATNKELQAFSHSAAHDLRTPLTSISLSCQVITEFCGADIKDHCRTALAGICRSVDRMESLIDGLLNFSSIAHRELTREMVNLSEMARALVAELQLGHGDRRVEVTIRDDMKSLGDASLLNVVLANLLGNAWKYTRNNELAEIEFNMIELEGEQVFFVRDNGAGFDATQADRLFAPFERLHSTQEFEGHGIGLATVQRIIQRHGGRIWAEGAVGKGATFSFTLAPP